MDGWTVLNALKADPETARIPVVICSVVDNARMGLALGVADYLTKPVDRRRLLAVLARLSRREARTRVLVVDDDPSTGPALTQVLQEHGWQVTVTESGSAARAFLAEGNVPGLILLDLFRPAVDGFGLVRELQARPQWRDIPVIVTAAGDISAEDRERLGGMVTGILRKGAYTTDQLLGIVRDTLARMGSPAA